MADLLILGHNGGVHLGRPLSELAKLADDLDRADDIAAAVLRCLEVLQFILVERWTIWLRPMIWWG